jgi:DNA repair exonuclease SbcCD nuclease subunit
MKKLDTSTLKRAIIVSDTHFGVRNSSQEWLEIMKSYFKDFFIPMLKRDFQPGDFVLHCGDVFDSRHSLNLLVMNEAIEIFEEISQIMPIVVILGNHDIYRKDSNEVNSTKALKWIPNVHIFEEPEVLKIANKKILLMPWRKSVEDEAQCVAENPADYMFCHTEVKGMKMGRYTESEHGLMLNLLSRFTRIYSGHIHYAQSSKNFRMVGCPYPMTRSDIGNEKGVWKVNFETDEETYVKNEFSPSFVRILFERVLEMELEEVNSLFKNNFVDILVHPKWSLNFPFSSFAEDLENTYRRLEFVPRTAEVDENGFYVDEENPTLEKFDILSLAEKVINNSSHEDKTKEILLAAVKKLHDSVVKENMQEYEN